MENASFSNDGHPAEAEPHAKISLHIAISMRARRGADCPTGSCCRCPHAQRSCRGKTLCGRMKGLAFTGLNFGLQLRYRREGGFLVLSLQGLRVGGRLERFVVGVGVCQNSDKSCHVWRTVRREGWRRYRWGLLCGFSQHLHVRGRHGIRRDGILLLVPKCLTGQPHNANCKA